MTNITYIRRFCRTPNPPHTLYFVYTIHFCQRCFRQLRLRFIKKKQKTIGCLLHSHFVNKLEQGIDLLLPITFTLLKKNKRRNTLLTSAYFCSIRSSPSHTSKGSAIYSLRSFSPTAQHPRFFFFQFSFPSA